MCQEDLFVFGGVCFFLRWEVCLYGLCLCCFAPPVGRLEDGVGGVEGNKNKSCDAAKKQSTLFDLFIIIFNISTVL